MSTIWSNHDIPGYLLKRNKNKCSFRACIKFSSSFIYDISKTETTKLSSNRWTDKQIMVYLYNELPLGSKNEWTIDAHKIWMNLRIIMLTEKSQTPQKGKFFMISFVKQSQKWKLIYSDIKQMSIWFAWMRGESMKGITKRYKETLGNDG